MTDPNSPQPESAEPRDDLPTAPPVPPAPPAGAVPEAPADSAPTYDGAPYVPPTAPSYDTGAYGTDAYGTPPAPPAYAPPTYAPPAYPTSPYGATPGGAPASPVQTAPGAAPVLPYGYGGYAPARKTNGLAVASMILSIVGFLWILPFVGSLAGAIMGHISLNQIKRSGEGGRGMALAGIIVGWAGLALLVIGVLFFVFVIALGASSGARYGA